MTIANNHTQACFNAWINCEELLVNLSQARHSFSKKIIKIVDECALICMGAFHAFKTGSQDAARHALLCIGICEECAEICEGFSDEQFLACARICRTCSETITDLKGSQI